MLTNTTPATADESLAFLAHINKNWVRSPIYVRYIRDDIYVHVEAEHVMEMREIVRGWKEEFGWTFPVTIVAMASKQPQPSPPPASAPPPKDSYCKTCSSCSDFCLLFVLLSELLGSDD